MNIFLYGRGSDGTLGKYFGMASVPDTETAPQAILAYEIQERLPRIFLKTWDMQLNDSNRYIEVGPVGGLPVVEYTKTVIDNKP